MLRSTLFGRRRFPFWVSAILAAIATIYWLGFHDDISLRIAPVLSHPLSRDLRPLTERYPERFPQQIAVHITAEEQGAGGILHALQAMGLPFFVTTELSVALRHPMVIIFPKLDANILSAEEVVRLQGYVRNGGHIFAQNVFHGGLKTLFGFQDYQGSRRRHWAKFVGSDPVLKYLDEPAERFAPLGSINLAEVIWTNGYRPDSEAMVLGRFEDGSAALIKKQTGRGSTYLVGASYTDLVLRNHANNDFDAQRNYVNAFEPGTDIWMLLLRAWYESVAPPPWVRLETMPDAQRSILVLSHDIDWEYAVVPALEYAQMERSRKVRATYFMQTKYFDDSAGGRLLNATNLSALRRLAESGADIESHSVSHALAFDRFPAGTGEERLANYRPRIDQRSFSGGTISGELRVSKSILDGELPNHVTTIFRAGHLRVPGGLPEALEAAGYEFDSSVTAGDVMTNYPFRLPADRISLRDSSVICLPVTIEDEASTLAMRLDQTLKVIEAIANNGGVSVILIHTNRPESKLPAEMALLDALPKDIMVWNMLETGRYWQARGQLEWEVQIMKRTMEIRLRSPAAVKGITFSVGGLPRSVEGPDGTRLLGNKVVVGELVAGDAKIVRINF